MQILFEVYIQLKGVPPQIKILVFYLSVSSVCNANNIVFVHMQ